MSDLLKLELENVDAKALAAPYQNIEDRKEIFLKYLIVEAIKSKADIIDIQDSLFYSKKFYSLTRLFDFYVNNNVFDLIIVKPDEDELLFDIIQDDIHSNIYGYAVARVGADFETAELLGYFMAKDFNSIVNGKKINVKNLLAIDNFENIEILDSQMSLDDVSERYFELLSSFMDDDLDESGLAEFACLLCNSSELREAFSEIGRFDSLCEDMKNNAYLLEDNFLSVIGGEMTQDVVEENKQRANLEEHEYAPVSDNEDFDNEDLSLLMDAAAVEISAAEIDLGLNLDTLPEANTAEDELAVLEEVVPLNKEDSDINEVVEISDISSEDNLNDDMLFDLDEIAKDETEPAPINNEVILDDIVGELNFEKNDDNNELNDDIELDLIAGSSGDEDSPSVDLESHSEESVMMETIEDLPLVDSIEGEVSLDFDEIEPLNDELSETIDEPLKEDEHESLSLVLEEQIEIEEKKEEKVNPNESRLSAELASLSLKLEDDEPEVVKIEETPTVIEIVEESDLSALEDLSIIEEQTTNELKDNDEKSQEQSIITNQENVSDELMELLRGDVDSDITVDDEELYSILGMSSETESVPSVQNADIIELNQDNNTLGLEQGTTVENVLVGSDIENISSIGQIVSENEAVTSNNDLSLLYANDKIKADEQDDVVSEELPIGYKNITKRQNNKKTLVVVAALALLVVAGIGVSLTSSKTAQNDYEDTIADNEVVQKTQPIKPVSKPSVSESFEDDDDILPSNISTEKETKIETSRSNQSGAAPVILKAVAWQVPTSISNDAIFNKYLQIAGKNIKLNLATDLLDTDDFAYNNKIKISMTVKNNMPVKNIKVVESSGSKNVDDIVLQSIKQTLKYINTPVMSEDRGDREVILVISI